MNQPQTPTSPQGVRIRIQKPPSELPPNPPQDVPEVGTDEQTLMLSPPLPPPKSTEAIECDPANNRKYKLYITEDSSDFNTIREEVQVIDDDDDEKTSLEIPFSPLTFKEPDKSDIFDDDDDDDDDGKDEVVSGNEPLSAVPQTLPPKLAGAGTQRRPESAFVRNEEALKEGELQDFVESIVKGQVEIAHTITPDELEGTDTNLGIGGSGSVVK